MKRSSYSASHNNSNIAKVRAGNTKAMIASVDVRKVARSAVRNATMTAAAARVHVRMSAASWSSRNVSPSGNANWNWSAGGCPKSVTGRNSSATGAHQARSCVADR